MTGLNGAHIPRIVGSIMQSNNISTIAARDFRITWPHRATDGRAGPTAG
jgi:hypothetical protein